MRIVSRTLSAVMLVLSTTPIAIAQVAVTQTEISGGIVGASAGSVGTPLGGIANKPYSATVKITAATKAGGWNNDHPGKHNKGSTRLRGQNHASDQPLRTHGEPAIINTSVFDPGAAPDTLDSPVQARDRYSHARAKVSRSQSAYTNTCDCRRTESWRA